MTHLWSELNKTEKELEEAKATAANLREMLTATVEKATDLEKKVQQMTSLMEQNTSLTSQMAVLQGQLQENQTKLENDFKELLWNTAEVKENGGTSETAFGTILKREPTQSKLNSRGCQEQSSTDWKNSEEEFVHLSTDGQSDC